jgi:N-acetylglucosaminyldiphosphoundecaprenol N-acetyl-beta-D-mannosaminyltransferase
MTERRSVLGIELDPLGIDEAVERIIKASREPGCRYVVKPYVEFSQYPSPEILNEAWLSLPDGVCWQWAAHYQQTSGSPWQLGKTLSHIILRPERIRTQLPEKIAGASFTWPLLEAAARHGRSVFLVGTPAHGDIEETARTLRNAHPELAIAGTFPGKDDSGVLSPGLEQQLAGELADKRPDIVLLGLGHPLQEEVMHRMRDRLDHGVLIGEGGTFDYQMFGGQQRRAPRFMQRAGLEWLWRLALEPRRIRRQLAIPRFIIRVHRDLHRSKNILRWR